VESLDRLFESALADDRANLLELIPMPTSTVTITAPELLNCRLKLERATQLYNQLTGLIGQFIDTKPYGLSFQTDMKASELRFAISIREDPPIGLGLFIGDVVHNLATCLDHLVCALALKNGKHCEQTMFPMHTDAVRFNQNGSRWIKDLAPPAQAKIESLQPFNTDPRAPGQSMLAVLWELDRIDKHRLVHVGMTSMQPGADMKFSYPTRSGANIIPEGRFPGPFADGDIVARFRCVGVSPVEVNVEGNMVFTVGFGTESGTATGKVVADLLEKLWHRVAEIVVDFDSMF
jgi:hypothetical protein